MLANLMGEERADRREQPVGSYAVPLRKANTSINILNEIVQALQLGSHEHVEDLIAMEGDYQRGRPELARVHADKVLHSTDNPCIILLARTNHMFSSVALGDAETAFDDLKDLYWRCQEGLEHTEDGIWHGLSLICSLRTEALLAVNIFEGRWVLDATESIHPIFRNMLGHLMALRALRNGYSEAASGILYAYSIITPETDFVSQISLNSRTILRPHPSPG